VVHFAALMRGAEAPFGTGSGTPHCRLLAAPRRFLTRKIARLIHNSPVLIRTHADAGHGRVLGTISLAVNIETLFIFCEGDGVSLFHCHQLSHQDKGMMAKILFY
jgi:hypothetical protein